MTEKKTKGKQVNQRSTKPVRIDSGIHYQLKVMSAKQSTSMRDLIEGCLIELLAVKDDNE
jgi:hypothetical protein